MQDKAEICISCGIRLIGHGSVRFPCAECGVEIGRCAKCRKQSNPYVCASCGLTGP